MNTKFSIIIPTLWKSKRIHKLLKDLIDTESVGEIIIIDNSREFHKYYEKLPKVKVLEPFFNIYVNPAWNYGVRESAFNCIALVNDDISFDTTIFNKATEEKLKTRGFLGMHKDNYKKDVVNEPFAEPWVGQTFDGWGCLIMFHKSHWIDIPNELKIWFGDNFMREINPAPVSVLKNFPIESEMSTTSDESRWNEIKKLDTQFYMNNLKKKYEKV